jgi:PKD repeat protein
VADNIRANQSGLEAIGPYRNSLRGNQLGLEAIGPYRDNLRANQSGLEAIGILNPPTSNIRADQLGLEAIGILLTELRANQAGVEVCGIPSLSEAFVVTEYGNLLMDTNADVQVDANSRGLVDSGASLTLHNVIVWSLQQGSSCAFTSYGNVTAIGASTLLMRLASFNVQRGTCVIGSTSDATTAIVLGNGVDPVALSITGAFSADDTSALNLGSIPGSQGPASLTIGKDAGLALSAISFNLIGVLDLEGVALEISGAADGDSVSTTGTVIADFLWQEQDGWEPFTVFFNDASYEPIPVTWSWAFGDGGTSGLQNPVYAYAAAGDYVVTLTIASAGGASVMTRTITVT